MCLDTEDACLDKTQKRKSPDTFAPKKRSRHGRNMSRQKTACLDTTDTCLDRWGICEKEGAAVEGWRCPRERKGSDEGMGRVGCESRVRKSCCPHLHLIKQLGQGEPVEEPKPQSWAHVLHGRLNPKLEYNVLCLLRSKTHSASQDSPQISAKPPKRKYNRTPSTLEQRRSLPDVSTTTVETENNYRKTDVETIEKR